MGKFIMGWYFVIVDFEFYFNSFHFSVEVPWLKKHDQINDIIHKKRLNVAMESTELV